MERNVWNNGWKVKKQGDSHDFNLSWQDVALPHDPIIGSVRNRKQPNGTKKAYFENGAWEYVKVFFAPNDWFGKDVYAEFEGVLSHALVYVNGNYVGTHAYGYTEFSFNIAEFLHCGKNNVIKVVCKTGDDSRWYTGAGIYRDVHLLVANKSHIQNNGVRITALSANTETATVQVSAALSCAADTDVLRYEIIRADRTVATAETSACAKATQLQISRPALWSTQCPNLYSCRVTLLRGGEILDTACEPFGIRTLSLSAKEGLRINGEQVKLRGACIHHDNGVLGSATYYETEYRRVKLLKEAGFNAIRSAHHPMGRHLLRACDELGVLVMDETFDVWQTPKSCDDYALDFDANWQSDVAAMVAKDYNHPCVIMYSIGNEISDLASEKGVALAHEIAAYVKEADGTRYTTVAINGLLLLMQKMELAAQLSGESKEQKPKKDINEAMSTLDDVMVRINTTPQMDAVISGGCDAVDIAGYNYMHNRYASDAEKYPDRVIVGSETYAKYIAEMWDYIESHNNVIGDFTWTGWDYIGETGIGGISYAPRDYHDGFYGEYPYITAACGDLDITGFRTPQSYYREIVFGLRTKPYIAVHRPEYAGKTEYCSTWGWGDVVSSWSFDGYENVPLTVDVYGKGEVELFLNGICLGKGVCGKDCKCSFTVPYAHGTLEAVSHGEKYTLCSAEKEIELNIEAENAAVRAGDPVFLHIALTDKNGTVQYGKDRKVQLRVAGGELWGFGSGASQTEESYVDAEHTTYDGRAFAVVRASDAENLTVVASAEGITTKQLTLEVGR